MSYLDDAVHCIEEKQDSAFYVIEPTEHIDPNNALEATEISERRYQRDNQYDGSFHSVAHPEEDEWRVIVMRD